MKTRKCGPSSATCKKCGVYHSVNPPRPCGCRKTEPIEPNKDATDVREPLYHIKRIDTGWLAVSSHLKCVGYSEASASDAYGDLLDDVEVTIKVNIEAGNLRGWVDGIVRQGAEAP